MSLLLAFESAARHQSFTRAAQELSLTQSAVSRHVQALEQLLEVQLFRRVGRTIQLTDVGAMYLRELSSGLGRIRDATLQAIAYRSGGGSLHLAILPSVASKWLLPRLPAFYAENPNILVHIHSRIGMFDIERSGMDAAISNSPDGHWPGAVSERLLEEELVPVVSPRLASSMRTSEPAELCDLLLLQVAARQNVWRDWFIMHGLPLSRMRAGPIFELTSHLLQAVSADLGAGLVARFLIEEELRSGKLVMACGHAMPSDVSYYLFTPPHRVDFPPMKAFREWLCAVARRQAGKE
ncbi:LysR substrate-binding domain-containing protein [Pigmentiphaga soli]|uniref:LysR substrate-binding domain-containing protein n=2 Tax=Pigmentiphaga soli TaxID=1007095 RepID=A0ABP8H2D3_9BURK